MKSKVSKMKSKVENQKPFDVLMNEHFSEYQSPKRFSKNWFIPIVKEQSLMDNIIKIKSEDDSHWLVNFSLSNKLPKILLEINYDDEGNLSSIYVLYKKGGKLYRVVSQKDYGVIKSRMELKNKKYVPYEKCDLEPFNGVVELWDKDKKISSTSYKDGIRNGESITYYKDGDSFKNVKTNKWDIKYYYEKTTFKNGKKNGEYENTKKGKKGNYLNNKKNGYWLDSYKNIYKIIFSSYQNKFDSLRDREVGDLIERNFNVISSYQKNDEDCGVVFYVNGILNGDFTINGYEGKFELGLPNGVVKRDYDNNWKVNITSKYYVDGIIDTEVEYDSGDKEVGEETTFTISNYFENGFRKKTTSLSENHLNKIPTELTSITKQHLNEDLFYSIVKTELTHEYTLESFLSDLEVMNITEYNDDVYRGKREQIISLETKKYHYDDLYRCQSIEKFLIEKCGYPYYEERDKTYNQYTYYDIKTSNEFDVYSLDDILPKIFTLSQKGEGTKVCVGGKLFDLIVGEKINPIVIQWEEKNLQSLSDKMKISYEKELKIKELQKQREVDEKQKQREELGVSLSSFPMD